MRICPEIASFEKWLEHLFQRRLKPWPDLGSMGFRASEIKFLLFGSRLDPEICRTKGFSGLDATSRLGVHLIRNHLSGSWC
jgi:hypothetical protein